MEFLCLWDYKDMFGFGGDSEVIGRNIAADSTQGPWLGLHATFWSYLFENDETTLDEVVAFLDENEPRSIADLTLVEDGNAAREVRHD